MKYESGDTLICRDNNNGQFSLTVGKKYVVEKFNQKENGVLVTDDAGKTGTFYYAFRFKRPEVLPEELFTI